ncbi:Rfe UDP-N-acetylmuramyl pentapeptide phosphotransferase/UDP-N- acetylglucosamine-1-phosphate transferase [Candidatus Nanopelagicaceae bacterium]
MSISATQFAILGVAAFALTGLLTWPVRALAIRLGAMDAPNLARKTQAEPVPYLGGVAIALGISIVTFAAVFVGGSDYVSDNSDQLKDLAFTVLLPALVLGAMGLFDDLRSLSPWPRLIAQTVVGTTVAFVIVQNGTIGTPFGSGSTADSGSWINTLVTIVWIVGICNSINFFDNLDGAASGAVAIAALGVFVIAFDRGQELVSALSIVTAGATIGFLMWNKSPAKIYMGDAGALFLGVIISVATIRLNPGIVPTWKSLTIPVMLLAVPLLDTCVAVFSRLSRGLSPLTGGKDHLSHRLVRAGLTRPMAAISLWASAAMCAIIAVGVYMYPDSWGSLLIGVFGAGWLLALVLFLRIPSHD